MARRRFFVEAVERGHAHIVGQDAHHLTRVLRVVTGQRYEISDNQNLYLAEVETARKDLVSFTILERMAQPEPAVRITLIASLIKIERFEELIEKATELGVEAIVAVQAERSEKGLERAAEKRMARWRRIVREASEQSRRARLPELQAPSRLAEAIGASTDYRYMLEESGATPILSALPPTRHASDRIALLVGPAGAWTPREPDRIRAATR